MDYLGKCDYLALYDVDAVKTANSGAVSKWRWALPQNFNARKAPFVYLSVVNADLDDSEGADPEFIHQLRCLNLPTINYYSTQGVNGTIFGTFSRESNWQVGGGEKIGHFSFLMQSPEVQTSTNMQYLEFDVVNGSGANLPIGGTTQPGIMNLILKLEYPERLEISSNLTGTYVQSINPLMTPPTRYTM